MVSKSSRGLHILAVTVICMAMYLHGCAVGCTLMGSVPSGM